MKLKLLRFSSQKEDTLGLLYIDSNWVCFTLEDEFRTKKLHSETRILAGEYEIKLRTVGSFHQNYLSKFGPDFHKGMLWLQNVPNFEYILIHIGNKDDDTAGCILVGDTCQQNITEDGFIGSSNSTYKRIYPIIRDELLKGNKVTIKIVDNIL